MPSSAPRRSAIPALAAACLLLAAALPALAVDGTVASADGVAIHYTDQGAGDPALVFVHGWSCDATYWDEQVTRFAATHRVVAIDLAGHGKSGVERKACTMEAFGADVAAVLKKLDLKGAILVGHSMGGPVAVEAALAAPDRVAGVVAVDDFQNVDLKLPEASIDVFLAPFVADFKASVKGWVPNMFPAGADTALVAAITNDMASAPPAVAISALRNLLFWFGSNMTARLKALPVPLMCINADQQPTLVEPIKALVPGYQLRVLPGSGHFLMREKPAAFNALLAETVAEFAKK